MATDGDDRTAVLQIDADPAFDDDRTVVAGAESASPEDEDATIVRPRALIRARLVVRDAAGNPTDIPLEKPDILIGRGSGCDVTLTNPEVSRQHARIVQRGDTRVLVTVGTRGNTFVNGAPTSGEHTLRHGDVILLASEQLVYATLDDLAATAPAASAADPIPSGRARPEGGPVQSGGGIGRAGIGLGILGATAAAVYLFVVQPSRAPTPPPAPLAVIPAPPIAAPAPPPVAAVPDPPPQADPPPAPVPPVADGNAEQIRKLVYRGDVAYLEKRYLTPPDDSAVYLYTEVLKLDPENERARAQIGAITNQYVTWAEEALARKDRGRAREMTGKATYVVEQATEVGVTPDVKRRLEALSTGLAAR